MEDSEDELHYDILEALSRRWRGPARPIMSQEAFDALPKIKQCFLVCNVIGCKRPVSTRGLVCVEHSKDLSAP